MNNNANTNKVSENKVSENKVSENKVFSEEFDISSVASTELTHVEKDGLTIDSFQYKATDKDGNTIVKSTKNLTTMQVINAVQFFANLDKVSNKAIATEWGRITPDLAKAEGFKTVAEMIKSVFPEFSNNTINQYRRVGQFFCVREEIEKDGKKIPVYRYRAGINESVNITNLTQVISLAKLPENFEKLTKEETDKIYSAFYMEYIESGKINLNLPQNALKKQIKDLLSDNKAIDTSFTEKKAETTEETENKAEEPNNSEKTSDSIIESPKRSAIEAILLLSNLFVGNTKILRLLSTISDAAETLPDEIAEIKQETDNKAENVENSDNSTEKQ